MAVPCSTAAAVKFIDALQPTLPLVFPTAEEIEIDQEQYALTDPYGLGHGFDFDDNDYGGPLSAAEFRLRTTLHECDFCAEFVSAGNLSCDVQFVLTITRAETGQLAAALDFLRSYSYSSRGVMEYGDSAGLMRANEIRQMIHIHSICRTCRSHLESTVFPDLIEWWGSINVGSLARAGGVITERAHKRFRLESGVKIEQSTAIHPIFDMPDLLNIIANYCSPLASLHKHAVPASEEEPAAAAAPAASIGSKRALSA
jgi:hypothetical protein